MPCILCAKLIDTLSQCYVDRSEVDCPWPSKHSKRHWCGRLVPPAHRHRTIAPHLLSTSHFAIIKTARSGSNQPNEQTKGRRAKPNRGTFVWCRAFGGSRDGLARSARPTDRPLVCCYLFVVRGRRRTPGDEAVACVLEHALWSACPLTHSSLYFLFRLRRMRVLRQSAGTSAG